MPEQLPSDPAIQPKNKFNKWLLGALGIASAAVLGVVISRRVAAPKPLAPPARSPHLKDWKLIDRIDSVLEHAGIDGIDVYVRHERVMLAAENEATLVAAKNLIEHLPGVGSVEMTLKSVATS
ncbi:MAG: hypothetical protein IAF08_11670 [Rhizobacter sp.]|nr:hypothetical protein [Chlorobiales bacterium]